MLRCLAQLALLGLALALILRDHLWWLALLFGAGMTAMAAAEAVSRPSASYEGMLLHVLGALGASAALVLAYALLVVLRPSPLWAARWALPFLGLLLGGAVGGVSVGLTAMLEELGSGADRIEVLLALGASRREATAATVQRALSAALTPALSHMGAVGLAAIPALMSGEIMAGASAGEAAALQATALFCTAACTGLAAAAAVLAAAMTVVDGSHRLRLDRLHARSASGAGMGAWVQAQLLRSLRTLQKGVRRGWLRLQLAHRQRAFASQRRGGLGLGFGASRSQGWLARSTMWQRFFGGGPRSPSADEDADDGSSVASRLRAVFSPGSGGGRDADDDSVLSGGLSDDALAYGGGRSAAAPLLPDD
ncbi:hypothetical protein WJX81_003416 [Elliptochloris bilobata]|uniref:Uncharacterized protein n=1 Tax=Elliptochloris bilobata TaxID=381761 RepID=A0AAW1RYC5_9CHLO